MRDKFGRFTTMGLHLSTLVLIESLKRGNESYEDVVLRFLPKEVEGDNLDYFVEKLRDAK